MKKILAFLVVVVLGSCGTQSSNDIDLDEIDYHVLDFSEYKRDPPREDFELIFPQDYAAIQLDQRRLVDCEIILREYVDRVYNANSKDGIDLSLYGRQYIGVKSPNGEEFVYVNGFCEPERFSERNQYLVRTSDGGACYFQVKIDLAKRRAFDFSTNGNA